MRTIFLTVLLVFSINACYRPRGRQRHEEPAPSVCLEDGPCYKGSWMTTSSGTRFASFQAIRYGQAPVGELRFRSSLAFMEVAFSDSPCYVSAKNSWSYHYLISPEVPREMQISPPPRHLFSLTSVLLKWGLFRTFYISFVSSDLSAKFKYSIIDEVSRNNFLKKITKYLEMITDLHC